MAIVYEYVVAAKNKKIPYDSTKFMNKKAIEKSLKHKNAKFVVAEKDNTITVTEVTLRSDIVQGAPTVDPDPEQNELWVWRVEEGHWSRFDLRQVKNCVILS